MQFSQQHKMEKSKYSKPESLNLIIFILFKNGVGKEVPVIRNKREKNIHQVKQMLPIFSWVKCIIDTETTII